MLITAEQLRSIFPLAYQAMLDEGDTVVEMENDDHLVVLGGVVYLHTRGGDPSCDMSVYAWSPEAGRWESV